MWYQMNTFLDNAVVQMTEKGMWNFPFQGWIEFTYCLISYEFNFSGVDTLVGSESHMGNITIIDCSF